jgi:transposase
VVGFVVNRDGFPKAHEVFDGNRGDVTTLEEMLATLWRRVEGKEGTVVVDRGLASADNLEFIRGEGLHYVVSARQEERARWLSEFEGDGEWSVVEREPPATNPSRKKPAIRVMKRERDGETFVLCVSEERVAKDRAIRENHEKKLLIDLGKLAKRIEKGRSAKDWEVHESIGLPCRIGRASGFRVRQSIVQRVRLGCC